MSEEIEKDDIPDDDDSDAGMVPAKDILKNPKMLLVFILFLLLLGLYVYYMITGPLPPSGHNGEREIVVFIIVFIAYGVIVLIQKVMNFFRK